jgi:hypothetical protein
LADLYKRGPQVCQAFDEIPCCGFVAIHALEGYPPHKGEPCRPITQAVLLPSGNSTGLLPGSLLVTTRNENTQTAPAMAAAPPYQNKHGAYLKIGWLPQKIMTISMEHVYTSPTSRSQWHTSTA